MTIGSNRERGEHEPMDRRPRQSAGGDITWNLTDATMSCKDNSSNSRARPWPTKIIRRTVEERENRQKSSQKKWKI